MAINFPDSPTTNDLFTSGGKTWEYDGTAWTIKAATTSIATGSITYDKLASDAVTTVKIADGAITAAKIADGTVVAAEIANNAITTDKIAAGAVTAAKLGNDISLTPADGSITQAKLGTTLSAVTVTTAANRDTAVASPFTGQLVFLTDTKKIQVWDGTSWLNITLAPPETPTSLSATALSTTSVSIAFTAGGANGSPITNYKYALSTNSGSTYGSFTALSPEDITTPITISGLTQNTAYYIKLKAVNDMGDSVASAAVSISTLSTPDAPTSLSAGSITTTSVDISFTPGAQGGSAISNYQYALSTNGGSTYGSFTALATPDATSPITITGLTADTAYYVKIKAVNTDGAGTESSAISFSTQATLSVDYLVVAGGGGGSTDPLAYTHGGGGGAGGLRSTVTATGGSGALETGLSLLSTTNYTVTVGAGGAGQISSSNTLAVVGSNSVFSTITSLGGGRGGIYNSPGGNGGSGGGGATPHSTGGTGQANQGFNGGLGTTTVGNYDRSGGGGGGASAVGGNGSGSTPGAGGAGRSVSMVTSTPVIYAGGGGGGSGGASGAAGGTGGGGAGAPNGGSNGVSGSSNTGGGGGGGSQYHTDPYTCSAFGGTGGSGVVIIRYPVARTITIGAGLTGSTATDGSYKVTTITAGTGNVSWA